MALDPKAFQALIRHLGFVSAACYRMRGDDLVQLLDADSGREAEAVAWPAAAPCSFNYTSTSTALPPLGWRRPGDGVTPRKHWPKGASLYFPEQGLCDEKLAIAVVSAPGKRLKANELHAGFEAFAARVRHLVAVGVERAEVSESSLREHIKSLGVDLQMLLDHEIRTPLASVSGYALLLREIHVQDADQPFADYWQVIESQLTRALEAIDKLSLALASDGQGDLDAADTQSFDAAVEIEDLCRDAKQQASELVGAEAAGRTQLRVLKSTDQGCTVAASRKLFRWAIWEVLKNALIHARSGRVDVSVYTSASMLVIDIADDGPGVAAGSEELVFLRFYQDPATHSSRKGKRGLGLGLFLARHIVERHLGQLMFVRQRGASVFRFIWPLAAAAEDDETYHIGA